MSNNKTKLESILFDNYTTNRTDFRYGEITEPIFTVFKEKAVCLRTRPPPLKDGHTMTNWKTTIPFGLLHNLKPIVETDPRNFPKPCSKPIDHLRAEVQKSRPRLVMTPSVSLDDIENQRTREVLCKDMYISSTKKATQEAVSYNFCVKAPFIGLPSPSKPITLPKLQVAFVSPEWRMESVSWDKRQVRTFCDPTKQFWLARS